MQFDLLQTALKTSYWVETKARVELLNSLPLWIQCGVEIYEMNMGMNEPLYLVVPKKKLEFDQLKNIIAIIEKKLKRIVLLVANDLPSKYRSLFVREGVPFVYKNNSIFAPQIGIKLMNFKEPKLKGSLLKDLSVSPFELKLLAGYLTGHIANDKLNLNKLETILAKHGGRYSKSKLSNSVNHLLELDYMDTEGHGPHKVFTFKAKEEVWSRLQKASLKAFSKSVECYYLVEGDYIFSGESALAHYSNLADPRIKYLAVTNNEFLQMESQGKSYSDFSRPLVICDIFKEPPGLFANKGEFINQVELYFLLKSHQDERIQIALEEMLSQIGLKA